MATNPAATGTTAADTRAAEAFGDDAGDPVNATSSAPGARESARDRLGVVARSPYALWGGFVVAHVVLWLTALLGDGMPLGDVTLVYLPWAQNAQDFHVIMGLNAPWVYPVIAMIPVMIPLVAGAAHYVVVWLAMVTLFNGAAFALLLLRGRRRPVVAAWWWLGFLVVLGPIAMGRLDAISSAIAIVAVTWLARRPRVAAVLLAIATWIKVWPAGIILAVIIAVRRRWAVLAWVVGTSVVVVILAVAFGGFSDLFSFVTQQTGRGLQIEAPVSAPWMWAAAVHARGVFIYYDQGLHTFQITGANSIGAVSGFMTLALAVAVIAVSLIGLRAVLRKAPTSHVLPQLALGIVAALIAFNKVGSPQYIDWLAAPVVLGIIMCGRRFLTPAILVAVTAALTQLFYPYLYDQLLVLNAWVLAALTARNVMLFVVLGWAIVALWRAGREPRATRQDAVDPGFDTAQARTWPLSINRP